MLFNEFVEGTGCRDNEHNYKIYKMLEYAYMQDDTLTKNDIYEYGKKLVNNDDTPEQIAIKEKMKQEIREYREEIKHYQDTIEAEKRYCNPNKDYIKYCKDQIKFYKKQIVGCKFVLG